MSQNIDINALVAKASAVGHAEIPVGGGNDSEAGRVLKAIFEKYPGKFFRSKDLGKILNDGGIKVDKVGNVLFAMKNSKACSQVQKGVYIKYDSQYDHNITQKVTTDTAEDSDGEDE